MKLKRKKTQLIYKMLVILFLLLKRLQKHSIAYTNAYASIADRLSSIEFKKAVKDFSVTVNQYANNEKGNHAVDVIVGNYYQYSW